MKLLKSALFALSVAAMPIAAAAQAPAAAPVAAPTAKPAADVKAAEVKKDLPPAPTPLAPKADIGQPVSGKIGIQPQVTDNGEYGLWMHDKLLNPIIFLISAFVLLLLFYVMFRFRASANPVPSKNSHNTVLEVAWTLIPVLILVGISLPSISLLAAQFKPAGKDAVTIKIIGHQWYWSYEYPDHGDIGFDAYMLKEKDAAAKNETYLLGVDNRLVLPVDTEIKAVITSDDVIHAWAIPAFWTKMDAVPGRLNEVTFKVQKGKEGVYYGQCSELCGARHGFMPIAVEIVTKENFAKWVASKGGKMPEAAPVAAAAPSAPAPGPTPAPAPKAEPAPAAPVAVPANAIN